MKKIIYLAIAGFILASCGKGKEKQGVGEMIPTVEVANPEVDSVTLHRNYPGYIRASNSVDVVARVSGQVLASYYQPGDYVTKGQVLFRIESSKYRDVVQQAEASLRTAESQYAYASKQYAAMKKAYQVEAVSEMEVLQAESDMNTSKAAIQNARAALATARENLSYCTVRAPRSGHCTIPTVSNGAFVNGAGAPVVLATIYDDSKVKAVFNIEDGQYELMMQGNQMNNNKLLRAIPLHFQQELPHKYYADLSYVSPNVETQTGTIILQGELDNSQKELKDGMFVTVSLPYGTEPKAILVRDASIGTDQLGKYLYVVNDSNKVVYTPIEVGEIYHDSLRIVTKGIQPNSRYVTKALLTVRNGEAVKPQLKK